jgi:hypothetical protein
MTDRQPFSYVVLRYRHDALAGELVNVGVVLFAPKSGFLQAAVRTTYGRFSKLYPDFDGSALTADLRRMETGLKAIRTQFATNLFSDRESAATLAKRVLNDPAGSYIWSDLGFGTTASPEKELNRLYDRYVGRFDVKGVMRRSDADIWRPARDRIVERRIADFLETKTIRSDKDEVSFDHAWKNGVWHCIQPLSFDLADADSIKNKAARWVGHMYGLAQADDEFRPYFIVGEPAEASLQRAFERAVAFLEDAPTPHKPRVVRESEIEDFVDELAREIELHQLPMVAG